MNLEPGVLYRNRDVSERKEDIASLGHDIVYDERGRSVNVWGFRINPSKLEPVK